MTVGSSGLAAAIQRLAVDAVSAEVLGGLERAGCRSLVLRGPAIARALHHVDGTLRTYRDTDLLVAPDDLARVGDVLRAAGFRLDKDHRDHPLLAEPHAQEWVRGRHEWVDLHWRVPGVAAEQGRAWELLGARAEPIVLGGITGACLDRVGLALLVALHAAHHARNGERPVQVMEDLARAIERFGAGTWSQAATLAGQLDAMESFNAGLRLVPAGVAVASALGLPELTTKQRRTMRAPSPGARGVEYLLDAKSARARARVLRTLVFPPAATMRESSSLARRGAAGLAAAYGRRLAVRCVQLPVAIASLARDEHGGRRE